MADNDKISNGNSAQVDRRPHADAGSEVIFGSSLAKAYKAGYEFRTARNGGSRLP